MTERSIVFHLHRSKRHLQTIPTHLWSCSDLHTRQQFPVIINYKEVFVSVQNLVVTGRGITIFAQ